MHGVVFKLWQLFWSCCRLIFNRYISSPFQRESVLRVSSPLLMCKHSPNFNTGMKCIDNCLKNNSRNSLILFLTYICLTYNNLILNKCLHLNKINMQHKIGEFYDQTFNMYWASIIYFTCERKDLFNFHTTTSEIKRNSVYSSWITWVCFMFLIIHWNLLKFKFGTKQIFSTFHLTSMMWRLLLKSLPIFSTV